MQTLTMINDLRIIRMSCLPDRLERIVSIVFMRLEKVTQHPGHHGCCELFFFRLDFRLNGSNKSSLPNTYIILYIHIVNIDTVNHIPNWSLRKQVYIDIGIPIPTLLATKKWPNDQQKGVTLGFRKSIMNSLDTPPNRYPLPDIKIAKLRLERRTFSFP